MAAAFGAEVRAIRPSIEWARNAEQFITGSTTEREAALLQNASSGKRRSGASIRDAILQLFKGSSTGLSRDEILQHLQLKGDKIGETAVSNALTALTKRQELVRRERKYLAV